MNNAQPLEVLESLDKHENQIVSDILEKLQKYDTNKEFVIVRTTDLKEKPEKPVLLVGNNNEKVIGVAAISIFCNIVRLKQSGETFKIHRILDLTGLKKL